MSWDMEIVVRGRKRKLAELRALATQLHPLDEPEDDLEEEASDDEAYWFSNVGVVRLERLKRGWVLHLDSQEGGNRDNWQRICAIAIDFAQKLGTVVEDEDVIAKMREETVLAEKRPESSLNIVFTLEDGAGAVIETARLYVGDFGGFFDVGNMPKGGTTARFMFSSEDYRYEKRARLMRALFHDKDGTAYRRMVWQLDGYGRVRAVDTTEL